MFSAVKALNREKFENPKVEDSEGKLITNPNEILKTITNHFENKFKDINTPEIPPFIGKPKLLNHPITQAEIRKNLNRLKNNKAPGEDQIYPELLEHALKEVHTVIGEPKSPLEEKIPREIAYANDVDFVGLEYIDIDAVQRTLHRYNLKVNIDKTEKT